MTVATSAATQSSPETLPRWASVSTTATYMDKSSRTIWNYIERGVITPHRLPGARTVWIDLNEVDRMLRAGVDPDIIASAPAPSREQADRLARLIGDQSQ